jgi:hypothetical protein
VATIGVPQASASTSGLRDSFGERDVHEHVRAPVQVE